VIHLVYGEAFGVEPHLVEARTPLGWWLRWRLWRKAQYARRLHEQWNTNPTSRTGWSEGDREAFAWAMLKETNGEHD